MIALLRRLRRAGLREVLLTARVWAFVSLLTVLLRVCGVPRLLHVCTLRAPRPPRDPSVTTRCVERVLWRHQTMLRSPCLKRSLTLYRFLGGRATDLQICFGVRYTDALEPGQCARRLVGHAWLLRRGAPYLEVDHPQLQQFRVIYRYPTRDPAPA